MYNLSIIIPHYNSVNTLEKLLQSIPNNDDIQIVVVDDKSKKNLNELSLIIKKYSNLLFLKNTTTKKGAGVCRNIGLKNAQGKWILFADSDDYFLDTMYSNVSKYFNAKFDVIFFSPTSLEAKTGEKTDRHLQYEKLINNYLERPNKDNEHSLLYKFYVPWSKLINRKFLINNNIKFDEVIASNDVMFSTKVGYYAESFQASHENIYCALRYKGSLTTQINEKVFDSRLNVWIKYYNFLRENLNEKDFERLGIKMWGREYIVRSIKYRFSIKKTIEVYLKLRKNKQPILEKKLFNPIFLIDSIRKNYRKYRNERKFYSK